MRRQQHESEPEFSVGTRRWSVCVWGENPVHKRNVLKQLSDLPQVDLWEAVSRHEVLGNSHRGGVVLLLTPGITSSSDLNLIRRLKNDCASVFCIVDREDQGDVGAFCRILLEGADHVLDVHSSHCYSDLEALVKQAADRERSSQVEAECLRTVMEGAGFAGQSQDVLSLFRSVRIVSVMTDLPVLVTGETGTGKELVALAIHSLDSKRRHRPLVSINCAAVAEELAESELFGHQRGAFTGADRERAGLLRTADGGILFLDEVGELSLSLQAKLLRVLQSSHLRSVGADREVAVNVRVIAATNRCLEQMVREGCFREDLYHRLNVLSLTIPPLRARNADIEPLVDHFVRKHRSLWEGKAQPEVGADFIQALRKAALPGNVRQLENLVCRALVSSDGIRPLSLKDLPPEIWRELSYASTPPCLPETPVEAGPAQQPCLETDAVRYLHEHNWDLPRTVRHVESVLVRQVLQAAGGNQSEAARRLGITPRSVYNKLNRPHPD